MQTGMKKVRGHNHSHYIYIYIWGTLQFTQLVQNYTMSLMCILSKVTITKSNVNLVLEVHLTTINTQFIQLVY